MHPLLEEVLSSTASTRGNLSPPRTARRRGTKSETTDEELAGLLESVTARILVVGVGGAGNNAITRLMEVGVEGAETLAVNTDAQDLYYCNAHHKLLLGRECCGGLGAGNDPDVGEAAAIETYDVIKDIVQADLVFITAGMGGGTGTGAAPLIAKAARENGALTVAIVCLPFEVEGATRKKNATRGLNALMEHVDTLIAIPNEKLLEIAPDLSLSEAFMVADEVLVRAVKGIAELVSRPGLVNLDFADVRTTMRNGGVSIIALGEGQGENRAEEAVYNALQNPLIDVSIENARNILINVSGSADLQLAEAKRVVELVTEQVHPGAEIIYGALIVPELEDRLRVTIIASGVSSPYVFDAGTESVAPLADELGELEQDEGESGHGFDELGIARL
ncbi:MAG: cell division protein FtsZ [Candidatus Thorarchaeota archaeon]|nr:MAG: cell division protein FtsZ [Candidatus Thorarchaeota archaeon]RLI61572.1 MAG: cell division protein FtsZ [Candidatus Thorarchaeota archaeon]